MTTDLFYFSGTGNSLFVARELSARLPESRARAIIPLLRQDAVRVEAEAIGLVFPVHAMTVPTAVKQLLRRLDPRSGTYVFAVATRLGLLFEDFGAVDGGLKRKGLRLDAHFLLNMGSNDAKVKGYRCPTDAEIAAMDTDVRRRLDEIARIIADRRVHRPPDTEFTIGLPYGRLRNRLVERSVVFAKALSERIGGVNYFYADEGCTGCGLCGRVCLSGKIRLSGDRPAWRRDVLCHMCYACLNYCPKRSVQIKGIRGVVRSFTTVNERYSHPYATAKEIAAQKEEFGGE